MGKERGEEGLIVPDDPETTNFVNAIVARGQAAKANNDGSLPPGVTHEIIGETKEGLPILKRRRFA